MKKMNRIMMRMGSAALCLPLTLGLAACGGSGKAPQEPAAETASVETAGAEVAVESAPGSESTVAVENQAAEAAAEAAATTATAKDEAASEAGPTTAVPVKIDPAAPYAELYLAEIDSLSSFGDADQFAFLDVDGDEVPELVASSSEGSWEKDQIFLYTVYDNKLELLISDIAPGMEGHFISVFEGENIVERSGAAMGEGFDFYKIEKGQLTPVLSLMSHPDLENQDMEKDLYFVDDVECDEDKYEQARKDFLSAHKVMTMLDVKEMKVMPSGDDAVDEKSVPYLSADEAREKLGVR